jgi:hypothetical protein
MCVYIYIPTLSGSWSSWRSHIILLHIGVAISPYLLYNLSVLTSLKHPFSVTSQVLGHSLSSRLKDRGNDNLPPDQGLLHTSGMTDEYETMAE